jgi:hypothetical protein
MASAKLSRRVERVVGYPPPSEIGEDQRGEFHEALLDGDAFEGPAGEVAGGGPKCRGSPAEAETPSKRSSRRACGAGTRP